MYLCVYITYWCGIFSLSVSDGDTQKVVTVYILIVHAVNI